jgi:DNA-binding NtrC family response regulator
MVDEGHFNDELFYRVASLPLHMPALRERKEDIPETVKHFTLRGTNPLIDVNLIEFTDDAIAVLTAYHWPGNLTEMSQVISKIVSTAETRVVTSQQLPLRLRELKLWPTLGEYLAGQERQYMDRVIHACRGDKAAAAKVLGVEASKLG